MSRDQSRPFSHIRPTSESRLQLNMRLLPFLVVLLLTLQLVDPYRGWLILLVGLGGGLLVGYLWARSLARGLHLTREMRFGWAQVGDRMQERFTLVHDGWAPALWVEVADHSTMPDYQASRVTSVAARDSIRWHTEGVCTRRGLFTLGPTSLRAGDPFGLFTVSLHYPGWTTLLVMPPIVPLPTIEVAPGGRVGEGRPRVGALERTVSAAGVRDYLPGDSLRWIHWPTSARYGSLFIRLFDGTPAGDWWIFLDMDRRVQAGEGWASTEEHGVILAASLADRGLRSQRAVGLVAHGSTEPSGRTSGRGLAEVGEGLVWLPPQTGDGQRWRILHALALVTPGSRTLAELVARARPAFSQLASLIIITPAVDGGWIEALLPLLRRGVVPTVLLLDPVSFGGTGDLDGTLALLADLGVVHYVVTRDLLDRSEARPGQQRRWEWQVSLQRRMMWIRRPRDMAWKVLS